MGHRNIPQINKTMYIFILSSDYVFEEYNAMLLHFDLIVFMYLGIDGLNKTPICEAFYFLL